METINLTQESTMKTYTNTGNKDTRSGFGAGLTELGKTNQNVVKQIKWIDDHAAD